jgi:hypothetical protein
MFTRVLSGFAAGVILLTSMSYADTNLVPTGDFEGTTSAWSFYKYTGTGATEAATLSFNAAGAHAGSYGALVHVTAADTVNWHVQLKFPVITPQANTVYQITYWAKGPGPLQLGVSDSAYN